MAAYACPHESGPQGVDAMAAAMPGCHQSEASDKARCLAHCHPQASSTDHAPMPTIPAAMLPATTWVRPASSATPAAERLRRRVLGAHATAPPLTIQHCSFQI